MNKPLAVALLSTAGLIGTAGDASADDFTFGISFGSHSKTKGFVGFHAGDVRPVHPRPIRPVIPVYPTYPIDPVYPPMRPIPPTPVVADCTCDCQRLFIPAHVECRQETVCEPAVYEDRCVPVFEQVCVPVYETVCVPVFVERCDPHTGRMVKVKIGERRQRVQIGTRMETVKTGERTEHVLVRPETCRTIETKVQVPGRYVLVCDEPVQAFDRDGADGLERMDRAQYDAEMARFGGRQSLAFAKPIR
jgi:hypothetical protein